MNAIDLTKKYKTRDGRAVTWLRRAKPSDGFDPEWEFVGYIDDYEASWTSEGHDQASGLESPDDLVLVDEDRPAGLITPDPLRTEYGIFVAAVEANFAAGTFATATQEQFDAWLESLTPSL